MASLNHNYLAELEEYMSSGRLREDFLYSPEERRLEILGFLEKLMDIGEMADDVATRIIFRKRDTE